ncbi:FAD-dependent monooxygenase [Actimicrobium sp. CCC2.4]|uniref:FAD-dependent oxidoreductase n=1 Tax=Actimicrobium sp. CCC2.4 TaxID=3048606 RepID=UPI002AC9459F|nr:FAD-dependent oxidoreductase [Actimicrobium sp. CCC2.4]MEB0135539.1 FAD-dependent monooxygenase [Actimicrobium sp. CCC2.4]WPX32292.1 FAD-dependent monooxygenase [Actimicrobium sp. CCC2.4]
MHTDICVIGNGTIGKTTALGLAQAGYRVALLCPPPSPAAKAASASAAWDLRVYALNDVARDVLTSLKVWDALDADRVAAVDGMVVIGDGDHAGKIEFDAYGAHVAALAWIVEHRNLDQALDAALRFSRDVTLVTGSASALHVAADAARIDLVDGSHLTAALVIGADGAHSWVRNHADIGIDYRPYEQRAVVSNFECSVAHQGVAYQWFTATEGIIALLPLAGQRVSLVWSAPDALAATLMTESPSQLAARLTALPGQPFGQLQPMQPERVQAIPLALIRAHQFVAPRIALLGDAAHAVHPLAGHGMNLGFGDVAALLRALLGADARRDCGDARLLAAYARSRKEEVLMMQIATDGLQRLFSSQFEPLRIVRNLGLNLLNKLPVIKRRLMSHAAGGIK